MRFFSSLNEALTYGELKILANICTEASALGSFHLSDNCCKLNTS